MSFLISSDNGFNIAISGFLIMSILTISFGCLLIEINSIYSKFPKMMIYDCSLIYLIILFMLKSSDSLNLLNFNFFINKQGNKFFETTILLILSFCIKCFLNSIK